MTQHSWELSNGDKHNYSNEAFYGIFKYNYAQINISFSKKLHIIQWSSDQISDQQLNKIHIYDTSG